MARSTFCLYTYYNTLEPSVTPSPHHQPSIKPKFRNQRVFSLPIELSHIICNPAVSGTTHLLMYFLWQFLFAPYPLSDFAINFFQCQKDVCGYHTSWGVANSTLRPSQFHPPFTKLKMSISIMCTISSVVGFPTHTRR